MKIRSTFRSSLPLLVCLENIGNIKLEREVNGVKKREYKPYLANIPTSNIGVETDSQKNRKINVQFYAGNIPSSSLDRPP